MGYQGLWIRRGVSRRVVGHVEMMMDGGWWCVLNVSLGNDTGSVTRTG